VGLSNQVHLNAKKEQLSTFYLNLIIQQPKHYSQYVHQKFTNHVNTEQINHIQPN
jgi:hypothetical protein